jgi:hypothetical protein
MTIVPRRSVGGTLENRRSAVRVLAIVLVIAGVCILGYLLVRPEPPPDTDASSRDSVSATREDGELSRGSHPEFDEDTAADEKDAPRPEGAAGGFWTVVVLGPEERPLPGVRLHDHRDATRFVTTGVDGRAVLTWDAKAETTKVVLSGRAPEGEHELRKRETTLRFPDLIPLDVVVIDGVSGYRLSGAQVAFARKTGPAIPFEVDDVLHVLAPSPLSRGKQAKFSIQVTPPRGYVVERQYGLRVFTTLSRFAKRVYFPVVVRPEANVIVAIEEHDGRPYAGARIESVSISNVKVAFKAPPTGANGETMIRGIPAVRGNRLWVSVVADERRVQIFGYIGNDGRVRLHARLSRNKPGGVSSSSSGRIGIGGGAGGSFGSRGWRRGSEEIRGGAQIRVLRRNGSAAVGAMVRLTHMESRKSLSGRVRTDGTILFEGLIPGKARVSVTEPGYLGTSKEFEVRPGETVRITVDEPEGLNLDVVAIFPDGQPVPCARIDVAPGGRTPFPILEDDVQILRLITDVLGRISLRHLPPGSVRITAFYGYRGVKKSVDAGGGRLEIEIR